jgi:hypothetical protein
MSGNKPGLPRTYGFSLVVQIPFRHSQLLLRVANERLEAD